MPKKQVRVVLHDADYPLAEKIREATGLLNLSDVFTLLIHRYGTSFLDWWVSDCRESNTPESHLATPSAIERNYES
jgi:hypothetical protein